MNYYKLEIGLVFGVIVFIIAMLAFAWYMPPYECNNLGEQASIETKYSRLNGCFVKVNGRWVPVDSWKNVQ